MRLKTWLFTSPLRFVQSYTLFAKPPPNIETRLSQKYNTSPHTCRRDDISRTHELQQHPGHIWTNTSRPLTVKTVLRRIGCGLVSAKPFISLRIVLFSSVVFMCSFFQTWWPAGARGSPTRESPVSVSCCSTWTGISFLSGPGEDENICCRYCWLFVSAFEWLPNMVVDWCFSFFFIFD